MITEEQKKALMVLRQQANKYGIVCLSEEDRYNLVKLEQQRYDIIRTGRGLEAL